MEHFLDMPEEYCELSKAKYVLISVPYDGTSTFMKGADKGPQAILDASDSLELYDVMYETEAYTAGIHTARPNLDFSSPEQMVKSVYLQTKHFLDMQKTVGILGGEHSVSIGSIQAHVEKYKQLSVIQIDAHADLRPEYHGSIYNHACVMRRAQEIVHTVVQVGIRNVCSEEKPFVVNENIFYAHQIYDNESWMQQAINRLSNNVYLSIDLDGFDPSILPATGTPLPGGLQWYPVLKFLAQLFNQKNVVGFDVVELCPHSENKSSDTLAATLVYKILTMKEINNF
jgi:agmatinase